MSVIPKRRRRKAEINIVPLVDVLVVLIFFFLVSMQFRNLNLMDLVLPQVETAGQGEYSERFEVTVDAEGIYYLQGQAVSAEALQQQLADIGRRQAGIPVLVYADENAKLQAVTQVMDWSRREGLERVRLVTR